MENKRDTDSHRNPAGFETEVSLSIFWVPLRALGKKVRHWGNKTDCGRNTLGMEKKSMNFYEAV